MSFSCGIVGLPNVGKSTLFNAITNTQKAESANYPFCTIEPNIGRIAVPDERLNILSSIIPSEKIIPNFIDIVDIAGLVRGASKGDGLGNQFLSNIKSVDVILHVVRCFNDGNITHVENSIDPIRDIEIIETELALADISSLEKKLDSGKKKLTTLETKIINDVIKLLSSGNLSDVSLKNEEEEKIFQQLDLLTSKPIIYIANTDENSLIKGSEMIEKVVEYANQKNNKVIPICASVESELSCLSDDERKEFMDSLGMKSSGLDLVVKSGYSMLDLITFFTVGPKETRAWKVRSGSKAPQAAGVIHTDFEKGFIRAETIAYKDFVNYQGEQGAKDSGKMRVEGKDYVVQDGDVMHFRFNV